LGPLAQPALLLLLLLPDPRPRPSRLWTWTWWYLWWYLWMMKMKMATRTSALGQVEGERHQAANELRVYSSFGESLQYPRKK
jgi:hypothetical protein